MSDITNALVSALQGASNAAASNVTGPVDAIAWALRKAGVPVPSNPILGSEWMRQKGLLADPQNKLAGLLGEAAGLSAPIAVAAKAPQIARGLLGADDALTAGANRLADHFENTGAAYRYDPKQRGAVGGFKYPQQEALDIAQRNAAKPVSEGGLGLPANNTPAQRAQAMGFDTQTFHATPYDWQVPDMSKSVRQAYGAGVHSAAEPELANMFARQSDNNAQVMMMNIKKGKVADKELFNAYARQYGYGDMPKVTDMLRKDGYDTVEYTHGQFFRPVDGKLVGSNPGEDLAYASINPANIRSRFAAFDPARINENNLLAGALPFTYLADEDARNRLAEALKGPR